jgi:hypothetical protein
MMKKNILAVMFCAGIGISFGASAAEVTPNTGFKGQGTVSTTNCKLLAQTVNLNMSNNVWGAYQCDEATSVISVGACHMGGSRSSKEVTCTVDPADATKFLPAGCAKAGDKITITDYVGYKAASNGGSIGTKELGGACAAGSVTGLLK